RRSIFALRNPFPIRSACDTCDCRRLTVFGNESRAGIAEIPKIEKPQRSSRGDCERFISPELNGLHARAEIGERHFELWWRFYQRREKCGARGEIRVREIRLLQQLQGEARLGARLMKCRLLNLKISSRLRAAFCAFPSLLERDHAADQRGNDQH